MERKRWEQKWRERRKKERERKYRKNTESGKQNWRDIDRNSEKEMGAEPKKEEEQKWRERYKGRIQRNST